MRFDDSESDLETLRVLDDAGRGFLGCLAPAVFHRYPYCDRAQFQNDFNHEFQTARDTAIEWFLVTEVDEETFTAQFLNAEEAPFSRWCAYDNTLELLLINIMKSKAHEIAGHAFGDLIKEAILDMGMRRSLVALGGPTLSATNGAKEPDNAWKPTSLPRGRSEDWPTVVLEVAYSETQSKLRSDVRYWLREPEEQVKTVLTCRIAQNEPRLTIERWERNGGHRGCCQQRVVVKKTRDKIVITGAPLKLEFARVFLRAPNGPREKDIEIEAEQLEFLAHEIWKIHPV
ncbi:hypothetical protein BJX64DRAFT_278988 [Aspergillus heterothallicus]